MSLPVHEVAWTKERYVPPFLLLPPTAGREPGPVPHLLQHSGKLTLDMGVASEPPQEHETERVSPASCLLCGGINEAGTDSPTPILPSSPAAGRRVGPFTQRDTYTQGSGDSTAFALKAGCRLHSPLTYTLSQIGEIAS